MVLYTALLLVKKLTSQKKKCSNGTKLMKFTGHTMLPTILEQLA